MNTKFLVVGFTTLGAAAGAAAGYIVATKRMAARFDEELVAEIEKATNHLKILYKRGDDSTPQGAYEKRIPGATVTNLAPAMQRDTKFDTSPETLARVVNHLKYSNTVEQTEPSSVHPYLITYEEFANSGSHDQTTLTYYVGDDTLADDNDEVVQESLVGEKNLDQFGYMDSPEAAIYVRDVRSGVDYEIVRSKGSYAEEVAGEEPKKGPRAGRFPEE